jgi:uncharacterized cupin superfamily protein
MHHADLTNPELQFDPDDPDGFKAGMDRFGPRFGAVASGASLYELPPGQALCPYHYEYAEEEWLLVLDGTATVRTPEGTQPVGPLQIVYFPTGPDGAHQVRNDSAETVRILMWSTIARVAATAYPDSDKIGIFTGVEGENVMVRRSANVDYYDGEA